RTHKADRTEGRDHARQFRDETVARDQRRHHEVARKVVSVPHGCADSDVPSCGSAAGRRGSTRTDASGFHPRQESARAMTIMATTKAADATQDLGAALAELARPGDVLLLAGELGAGKTALTQGFGRGLGITEQIISPTFMLARQHIGGRLVLHHLDVYRLEQ